MADPIETASQKFNNDYVALKLADRLKTQYRESRNLSSLRGGGPSDRSGRTSGYGKLNS